MLPISLTNFISVKDFEVCPLLEHKYAPTF